MEVNILSLIAIALFILDLTAFFTYHLCKNNEPKC